MSRIITIGREFGSGGREIGKRLSDELGIAYYDNERLKNVLKYILDKFKKRQIIIFTCTNREKEILDNLETKYNLINL